jgi:hypothetical protein
MVAEEGSGSFERTTLSGTDLLKFKIAGQYQIRFIPVYEMHTVSNDTCMCSEARPARSRGERVEYLWISVDLV